MERTYRNQFPPSVGDAMPRIPRGWRDSSWGNDACPSFVLPNRPDGSVDWDAPHVKVWVGDADPDMWECQSTRFVVVVHPTADDEGETVAETDDWDDCVRAAESARETLRRD